MPLLVLSQIRFLRFAPISALAVLLGVMLAVSSIVAVHQISQRVVKSLADVVPVHLDAVTHLLDRQDMNMADYFALRARWRAGELPGVVGIMPLIDGGVDADGRWMRLVGVDGFSGVAAVAGLALVPAGELIAGPGLIHRPGEHLQVNGVPHRIAGTHDSVPPGMLVTDIGTAQVALGLNDAALHRIAIVVDDGRQRLAAWLDRLLPGFSAGLSLPALRLPGWRVQSLAQELPSHSFARSVLFNLGALGSLALVVAWLLVFQVSVIWLRRRQLTLLRLRQMGASEGELLAGFLASLLCLGLLASISGLWLGDLLARSLSRAVTGYGDPVSGPSPIDGWVAAKAIGSAALVCLVGGWVAFRRETARARPRRWLLGALLATAAALAGLASGSLLGGFVTIAAAALVVLLGIGPLLRGLRGVSRRLRGSLLLRIGLRELTAHPADLSVALGALVLAVATSVAIALMVQSFRGDFERLLDQRLVYDLNVSGDGRDLSALADRLAALPGVTRVQRYGQIVGRTEGRRVRVGYTAFDAAESRRYGLAGALPPGACLISERLARDLQVASGQPLEVEGAVVTIAGVVPGFGEPVPRVLIGVADTGRMGIRPRFDRLSVNAADPALVAERILDMDDAVAVEAGHVVRARALRIFDQTFAITRALTLLALLVAAAGLYNALLALALLQQRARYLLRAMGVSSRERRSIDLGRVAGIGSAVVLFALPLGLLMGWLLCRVINPRAFGWSIDLAPSLTAFLWPVLAALSAMLLVGLLPVPREETLDET